MEVPQETEELLVLMMMIMMTMMMMMMMFWCCCCCCYCCCRWRCRCCCFLLLSLLVLHLLLLLFLLLLFLLLLPRWAWTPPLATWLPPSASSSLRPALDHLPKANALYFCRTPPPRSFHAAKSLFLKRGPPIVREKSGHLQPTPAPFFPAKQTKLQVQNAAFMIRHVSDFKLTNFQSLPRVFFQLRLLSAQLFAAQPATTWLEEAFQAWLACPILTDVLPGALSFVMSVGCMLSASVGATLLNQPLYG